MGNEGRGSTRHGNRRRRTGEIKKGKRLKKDGAIGRGREGGTIGKEEQEEGQDAAIVERKVEPERKGGEGLG